MNANHELGDPEEQDRDDDDGGVGGDVLVEPEEHLDVELEEEDDDNSDEEQEDIDIGDDDNNDNNNNNNEDLAIANNIFIVLEQRARSDGALSFRQHDEWDPIGWICRLTDQGMTILLDALEEMSASETSWDHLVEEIAVDVEDSSHDMNVARRITQILDCFVLASLRRFSIVADDFEDEEGALRPWKPFVVDHYLTWMATTTSISHPERLYRLNLECFGYDPKVWDPFVSRFSSIGDVIVGLLAGAGRYPNCTLHATGLALSLRRLPKLRMAIVQVCAAGVLRMVSCLCQGLVALPTLEKFGCRFCMVGTDLRNFVADDADMALNEIGNVLALCPALKHASIVLNAGARARFQNVGVLIDHLRFSGSITEFKLSHVDVCGPKQTRFHKEFLGRAKFHLKQSGPEPAWTPSKPSITNTSIKSLVLDDSSIGKSYSSAFASFEGIEEVSVTVENWRPRAGQLSWSSPKSWSMLFRTHPELKSLTVGIVDFNDASIDDEGILSALVASLDLTTSLHDLTVCTNSSPWEIGNVSLPSLDRLFRKCHGKLTLQHDGVNTSTTESLCAGLRATTTLTDLRLTVTGEDMMHQPVAAILASLQENRSVETFHGTFLFDFPVEVGVFDSVLGDLFASNPVLESFGLELLLRERFHDDAYVGGSTPPNNAGLVVAPIAKALAHNRTLKVLLLKGLQSVDPISFALLSGMLQTNVTLERIEFHDNVEDSEAKDEIEWLLTLNRYKRRCFSVLALEGDRNPRRLNVQNPHPMGEVEILPEGAPDPRPAGDPVPPPEGDAVPPPEGDPVPGGDPDPEGDPESLPGGVWSSVLERIATDRRADVMFHFLLRLPKSLLVSPPDDRGLERVDDGPDGADGGIVGLGAGED